MVTRKIRPLEQRCFKGLFLCKKIDSIKEKRSTKDAIKTERMEQMKELMEAAGDMSVTLHRAFDVCVDPIETMEQAISLGINTILTSGQRNVCLQGADLLKELVEKSLGRITIQAGSGVGAEVIRQLYPLTGVRAYHMTGKRVIDSEMQFRKDGVNMGLPMLSEYEIWRTDVDNIRAAKKVLEEL